MMTKLIGSYAVLKAVLESSSGCFKSMIDGRPSFGLLPRLNHRSINQNIKRLKLSFESIAFSLKLLNSMKLNLLVKSSIINSFLIRHIKFSEGLLL